MARALTFDADYQEDVQLGDDLTVRLRLIRPEDRERLQEGLRRLSPQSQYLRFFSPKPRLTEAELSYLTELDQWSHFAIGAVRLDADGAEGEGVGVARFIRLPEDERVAEPAIAVVDAAQGKGVGGLLMRRLSAAALERDVQAFRSEFLATNDGARELFKAMSDVVTFSPDGTVAVAEYPLDRQLPALRPSSSPERAGDLMDELLRAVASQLLQVQRRFLMWFQAEDVL
ncbi:MAG: GNAT family N-acetyltransferase, partial [Myxococcota bacterium]